LLSLEKLVEKSSSLGTLPAIVFRVFEVMDDPNSTATMIGRIVNDDPALTARLLKLVNSPFYGFAAKVDTVYRAIALLGHRELRSVVLAASAVKVFDGIPTELVSMPVFWKRSLYTAVVARVLAAYRRDREIERYFIAGLLHDIGSLLMYLRLPDEMTQVLQQESDAPVWQRESDIIGYNHAEVGGLLLKKWSLPPILCQAVEFHLYPEKAPKDSRDAAWLIHLANQIQRYHGERDPQLAADAEIDTAIWESAGLGAEILPQVLEKAGQQFEASRDALLS